MLKMRLSNKLSYKKILKILYYLPFNLYNVVNFYFKGVKFGSGLQTRGRIFVKNKGTIIIGNNFRCNSSSNANPIGAGDKTYFQVLKKGKLIIDNNTGISNTAITCANEIFIGKCVFIGAGCKIYDTDFHPINYSLRLMSNTYQYVKTKRVIIEDFVFIGAGCYILKGVKIGKYSIVGAGAVVSRDVPSKQIWAGNPAKYIRNLSDDEMMNFNNKEISL